MFGHIWLYLDTNVCSWGCGRHSQIVWFVRLQLNSRVDSILRQKCYCQVVFPLCVTCFWFLRFLCKALTVNCDWGPRDTHYSDYIIDERLHGDCCSHLSLQISRLFRKAPCGRPCANSKLEVYWTQEGSEEEYVIVGLTIPAARQQ